MQKKKQTRILQIAILQEMGSIKPLQQETWACSPF